MHQTFSFKSFFDLSLLLSSAAYAQQTAPPVATELTSFNYSLQLTPDQISQAQFSDADATAFQTVYNVEYSQYAGGFSFEDSFYDVPPVANASSIKPGTLLKTQDVTLPTNYSLAPNVALSRILYVSRNLNGTAVPASAFILWPFVPRQIPGFTQAGTPSVVWNHPTAGYFGPAAPSKHRTLWTGDNAPFALALAGYAVVAPDFVGLGVNKDFEGKDLPHQYIASPAQASDAIFAFRAARSAFPDRLSPCFVSMGHSQGGGDTWGVAELMAAEPELADGYLGGIAVSPVTNVSSGDPHVLGPTVGYGLSSVFPEFQLEDWLTPFGVARAQLLKELNGGLASALWLFATGADALTKPGFQETWYATAYAALANVGQKPTAGPLLVIHGTSDPIIPYADTTAAVNRSCSRFPTNEIELLTVNGTGHVPTLDASRQVWMQFIEDRFAGKPFAVDECGQGKTLESFLPIERYQQGGNSFVQWAGAAEYSYQLPLGA